LKWDKKIFIHNLLKPLPWNENSVDVIYSSHTLEHFTREEGILLLKECYRVLKPGGIIRVIVPDLRCYIHNYIQGNLKADHFIENLLVLYPKSNSIFKKLIIPFISFPHKCMYDEKTLLQIIQDIGFIALSKNGMESDIYHIEDIEDYKRTINAVIIEGKK